jgi:hypothetical protein
MSFFAVIGGILGCFQAGLSTPFDIASCLGPLTTFCGCHSDGQGACLAIHPMH